MPKKYAKAFFDLIKESDNKDEVVTRFIAFLKSKSKLKLLPKVLHELEKLMEAESKLAPKIILGSEKAKSAALKDAEMLGVSEAQIIQDKKLIGGYKIKAQGFVWDSSYRRYMLDLYEKLKA